MVGLLALRNATLSWTRSSEAPLVLFYLGTAASLGKLEKEREMILGFLIFCGTVKCCSLELPLDPQPHYRVISVGPRLEQYRGVLRLC